MISWVDNCLLAEAVMSSCAPLKCYLWDTIPLTSGSCRRLIGCDFAYAMNILFSDELRQVVFKPTRAPQMLLPDIVVIIDEASLI